MTRKRFIKLLMSHGETLYAARAIAHLYCVSKMPYKKAYSDYQVKASLIAMTRNFEYAFSVFGAGLQAAKQAFDRLNLAIRGDLND